MNQSVRYCLLCLEVGLIRSVRVGHEPGKSVHLDVVGNPLSDNPAHALIPQLNRIDYECKNRSKKTAIIECAERLIQLAKWVPDEAL